MSNAPAAIKLVGVTIFMKLVYYSPSSYGGLADYAHKQANALVQSGVEVYFLCTHNYPVERGESYQVIPVLQEMKPGRKNLSRLSKVFHYCKVTLFNYRQLATYIEAHNIQAVLLGSYEEYLAPIWSGQFRNLARTGVVFGAIIHDPVRDFILGPRWWHRWSIASAYSFLREAFVHETIKLNTVRPMPLRTTVIPHGPYHFSDPGTTREQLRLEMKIPESAIVLLSFGHIRDEKNLDLALKAIADFPNIYLIVAGAPSSSTQRTLSFYQNLAEDLKISDRCRWEIGFVPADQVADLFNASDIVLLTYSAHFRSASGVLNTAVAYRRPCIASAGMSNLRSMVLKYNLGIFVEPDNWEAIRDGIQLMLGGIGEIKWEDYERDNCWSKNAEIIIKNFE